MSDVILDITVGHRRDALQYQPFALKNNKVALLQGPTVATFCNSDWRRLRSKIRRSLINRA